VSVARRAVTLKVAREVLWHFGDTNLGMHGGHWVERLLWFLSACDEGNLERARSQWPEYTEAWEKATREPWGIDWLRRIVKDELDARETALDFLAADA